MVRLLSGFLSPTSGTIYINDNIIKKSERENYRNRLGIVMQEDTLFEGSLLENLTLNDPKITNDDVKWALDAVGLTTIIKWLPMGLDTLVNGRQLTKSVTQKIIMARAIISRPKLLFLEEPTSSMDTESAKKVIDFLTSEKNNWTIVISSVDEYWKNSCNRHILMENGKIVNDLKITGNA